MEVRTDEPTFLSFFEQAEEIALIVLAAIHDSTNTSTNISKFQNILTLYQESSELLDPYLESIIVPLTTALLQEARKNESLSHEHVKNLCCLLQYVTKVRGHKSVLKFYPVDVSCFVPVFSLLQNFQHSKGEGVWEVQCQLMLWLSTLSLVPFDLQKLDSGVHGSVIQRIQDLGLSFLQEAGTVREYACLLLYRLLTRPDMETALMSFMEKTLQTMQAIDNEDAKFQVIGATQAASFIFKHGQRAILLPLAQRFWKITYKLRHSKVVESSLLLRKLQIKLVQRLALTLLEPLSPKWRYVQTLRKAKLEEKDMSMTNLSTSEDIDEDYEVPDEIEEVIELLLAGVTDSDTNVRWSSSKGIGRVCARLPKSLANEVLSYILELFSETADDSAWHGACLSVAELARRGLLLPESIPRLVPSIEKALVYDVNRGAYSIGAHVRDSACYVCWACARSFDAEIMTPFMPTLAPVLMITACLDREVNCRRAAAAAFQECVGRIGNVPNGLDILQIADYFTLSKRSQAYLVVAPAVSEFSPYGFAFVAHLLFEKVGHWDIALRQLTADALGFLAKVDLEYFTCDVLDNLLAWSLDDKNLDLRHGASLSLASVLKALITEDVEIPSDRLTGIANIVMKIEKARLYRGKGGSIMRQAVSKIIESIAATHLTRSQKHRFRLLATINENIGHAMQDVTPDAIRALYFLSREFKLTDPEEMKEAAKAMTEFYLEQLHSENVAFRRGYTHALGQLPQCLLLPLSDKLVKDLCASTKTEEREDERDAESRSNAVKSLTAVVYELYSTCAYETQSREQLVTVMETLFHAMEDYAIDRRGDVGSWIREAAMSGLSKLLLLFAATDTLKEELTIRVVSYLIRNSVERISHIRQVAVQHLLDLLNEDNLHIPHRNELLSIQNCDEDSVFAAFGKTHGVQATIKFLPLSVYQPALLEGLIASIGGLEKSLSDAISTSLIEVLAEIENKDEFDTLLNSLLVLSSKYGKSKRMATPLLITINTILKEENLLRRLPDDFLQKVIKAVRLTLSRTGDFARLTAGASILSCLAFHASHATLAWKELFVILANKYPFVRKQTAEIIYEKVLFQEETPLLGELSQLLLETAWDGSMDEALESRLKLSRLLNIEIPVREKKFKGSDGVAKVMMTDENASYKTLVEDFARGM